MILGPVSLIDCLVFLVFLAPQLLIHVGFFRTLLIAIKALLFICLKLPAQFIEQRYWRRANTPSQFSKSSTTFEYIVVRCVRYAFTNIPAKFARVFFTKGVILPFIRWRMLRYGHVRFPVHWREQGVRAGDSRTKGIWIRQDPEQPPDVAVYFVHGGGFAMGTCYFYLEFLFALHHLLLEAGFKNPALFALDYTLVPDGIYPTQILETLQGYKHVLNTVGDASKVCVVGDSAGGTLILSLLLELGLQSHSSQGRGYQPSCSEQLSKKTVLPLPHMATLISPWVTLKSDLHYPSDDDFLDRNTLWEYAREYAGGALLHQSPASPGSCLEGKLWETASPNRGFHIIFGDDEVFAPDIENFIKRRMQDGIEIKGEKIDGGIHAWPVASLYLSSNNEKRLGGLRSIVKHIRIRSLKKTIMEGFVTGNWSD